MSLWGNDANAFVASCNGNVQCIIDGAPAAIAAMAANLSGILGKIHRTAPDARVVLLGAYDANLGAFPLTHPIFRQLNLALADAAAANRAGFADPSEDFNPDGDTGAALCTLTLLCSNGDSHPSDRRLCRDHGPAPARTQSLTVDRFGRGLPRSMRQGKTLWHCSPR